MSLQFEDKIFFHIGRTGGTYITSCIRKSAPKKTVHNFGHVHFMTPIRLLPKKNITWICSIRDPLEWYKSYFRYRIQKKWKKNHHIDKLCQDTNFEEFTKKLIYHFPYGYLSSFYALTVPFCDIVIDTKFLTAQLKKLFNQWNYYWYNSFKERLLVTNKNISTVLSDKVKTDFLEIEQGAINLYKIYASKGIK